MIPQHPGLVGTTARLDEFDLVAIRVLDKGDDGRAVLHRSGLAHHLAAAALDFLAGRVGIVDLQGNMTEPVTVTCYLTPGRDKPFLLKSNINEAYFSSDSTGVYSRIFKSLADFQSE